MLEGVLEQLLLQYLAPYVSGISREKVHFGVLSGKLELNDLTVEQDALAKLGMESYRVTKGRIGSIKISAPWSQLYSGKLKASVEGLKLEVESIAAEVTPEKRAELIRQIREAKQHAISVRVEQLSDLLLMGEEAQDSAQQAKRKGTGVMLVRRVLHNITVNLSDVEITWVNRRRCFACALGFRELAVSSTDETFRERGEFEEVVVNGTSMHKLLRLVELSLKMSPAGRAELPEAEYVLSPLSASCKLAHVPGQSYVHVRIEVATEEMIEVMLRRSQVKHVRGLRSEIALEKQRLFELMVPPTEERLIFSDSQLSRDEYSRLYERYLLAEWRADGATVELLSNAEPLSEEDIERMRLLEDAFSTRVLAVARLKVRSKLQALIHEFAQAAEEEARAGFFGRFRRKQASNESDSDSLFSEEQRSQLLKDFDDELETVDLPTCFKFEFVLGKMALDLIDDQWHDEVKRQLMSLALKDAHITLKLDFATDHRGQDSAEWGLELAMGAFHAFHKAQALFTFCPPDEERWRANIGELQPLVDSSSSVARLQIESKLKPDMNLLSLTFEFAPVQIHFLPGIAEYVVEFWRSPVPRSTAQSPPVEQPALMEDLKDMTKRYLEHHGDQAKKVAEKVYERIPDRLQLRISIASPILHVPVKDLGTAMLSLGELKMETEPCAYNSIDMVWLLDKTAVTAKSCRGERFDMIQPVPIHMTIEYRSEEHENKVTVQLKVEEMVLSLSPQALQILVATPGSMLSILWPPAASGTAAAAAASQGAATPAFTRTSSFSVTPNEGSSTLSADIVAAERTMNEKASKLAKEVLPDKMLGKDGDNVIQAAARKVEQVRKKVFRLNLGIQWDALDITLSDSIVPMMRLRLELMDPSLVMYQQSMPYMMKLNILNCALAIDVLNSQNGCWEPLAERVHLAFEVDRKQADEDRRSSHLIFSGYEPLLLNFSPTMLRQARQLLPLFVQSVTSSALVETRPDGGRSVVQGAKYRVVNLCKAPIELCFKSRHREGLATTIEPTGSNWRELDGWVLPHFATAIAARLPGKNQYSEWLSLERLGAVAIPSSNYVAELLTPGPSHRLLLLATPLRVHNQTDVPLHIRFFDETRQEVRLLTTGICDAALVGHALPSYLVRSELTEAATPENSGTVALAPNTICSVPSAALFRAGTSGVAAHRNGPFANRGRSMRTWLSVKPAGVSVEYSVPQHAGAQVDPCTLFCRGEVASSGVSTGNVNLVCESQTFSQPPVPTLLTTVTLQPTLALLNALPIGKLEVRCCSGWSRPGSGKASWLQVSVPRFSRLNIYSFPVAMANGIAFKARLDDGAPWSQSTTFEKDAIKESDNTRTLGLSQAKSGAAAAVTVEPLNSVALRFSCPNWFINRSGLPTPLGLEVQYQGKSLPQDEGVTLLPAEVLERPCDLVLRGGPTSGSRRQVRLPPSWTVFPWHMGGKGCSVFCVQNDDVAPDDVLGAQCQVMTLRPRLVLTNASDCDVEVSHADSVLPLIAGQSAELHWQLKVGEEDHPTTSLRFRPVRCPPCQWSGKVICGDSAAGSTPFALTTLEDATVPRAPLAVEVWSVEVAPERGALAVSFREGSEFVAVNKCVQAAVPVFIRPHGCNDDVADVEVPVGQEVPFGWMAPFQRHHRRSVDVIVDQTRIAIADVRKAIRSTCRKLNVVVVVSRVGARTLLSVQDFEGAGGGSGGGATQQDARSMTQRPSNAICPAKVLVQLDIRLSRLGISLVDEVPTPRELLYMHFDLIRFTFERNDGDVRSFRLAISEAQVDCQLPGRVDANTADRRRDESLALLGHERPAVILANHADGDRAFLTFLMQRGASGSQDILLRRAEIGLDALDITIDDGWLDPLVTWLDRTSSQESEGQGIHVRKIRETANKSALEGYVAPALPKVIQVDQIDVGAVTLTVWCALKLKTVRFLPQYVRTAMRVLSLSGQFVLDGAQLLLPESKFPPHRGSFQDFLKGLANEYMKNLISNAATMLGKSSLLNLPRVPLKFGSTVVSYLTDSLGLAAGEAASLMAQLTFDEEYIRRQRQIREEKRISGLSDGVVEAGKSIAQGIESFADICWKPVEGAQRDGFSGLVSGLCKGIAGTCVKPIEKLGQAISDVGSGIAAQVAPDTASMKRRRARVRQRLPRLFAREGGIRPWSELEAETLQQLGLRVMANVEEVLPLTPADSPTRMVMLLYGEYMLIVPIKVGNPVNREGRDKVRSEQERVKAQVGDSRRLALNGATERPYVRSASAFSRSSSTPLLEPMGGSASMPQRAISSEARSEPRREERPQDILDALEESTSKLFLQALKPINTLVYGMQDMEAQLAGKASGDGGSIDPSVLKQAREFYFQDLREVILSGEVLKLLDLHNKVHSLPLGKAPFGPSVRKALARGFKTALTNANHRANWEHLHLALRHEERETHTREMQPCILHMRSGPGYRVLEVFEVERKVPVTGAWATPFLPMDRELSWRWVDATGTRHPHLRQDFERKHCVEATVPPCEIRELFTARSPWEPDVNDSTDAEGWRYGLAWNSSTWDARPGLFDAIRKRRWTKKYG